MEPGVMRHNAPFLAWLLFSLWDLLSPRVRFYLTFMAILTLNKLMCATARALLARSPPILAQLDSACCVSSIVMYVCNNLFILCLINIKHTRIHRKQKKTLFFAFSFSA